MFSRPLANTALEIQFCFGNILNTKLLKRFGRAEPDDGSGVVKTITRRYADPGKSPGFSKVSYVFFVPLANRPLEIQFCFRNILNKKLLKRFGRAEPDYRSVVLVVKTITRRHADPAK